MLITLTNLTPCINPTVATTTVIVRVRSTENDRGEVALCPGGKSEVFPYPLKPIAAWRDQLNDFRLGAQGLNADSSPSTLTFRAISFVPSIECVAVARVFWLYLIRGSLRGNTDQLLLRFQNDATCRLEMPNYDPLSTETAYDPLKEPQSQPTYWSRLLE